VIERLLPAGEHFEPNSVRLDTTAEQILIITGPNMSGKSSFLRQAGLIVLLAQIGCHVPARKAVIGIVDKIFTRVGASDNISSGESTFLVEMHEAAHIVNTATARSLILLDEVGRGTSTFDGISIAWALTEYLHEHVGARTLFATHYHELCDLGDSHPRVRNVSVAAREWKGEVVFLRKLTPGGTSRSFGIEVAKLAGLPHSVVGRARAILERLQLDASSPRRPDEPHPAQPGQGDASQLGLFEPRAPKSSAPGAASVTPPEPENRFEQEVVAALRAADLDGLSPRAAWDLLAELRKKLTDGPLGRP
jgi:DNA mismatch repair protein MutS